MRDRKTVDESLVREMVAAELRPRAEVAVEVPNVYH
jgi:hypothetical protein